jgi:hypothetical protein
MRDWGVFVRWDEYTCHIKVSIWKEGWASGKLNTFCVLWLWSTVTFEVLFK